MVLDVAQVDWSKNDLTDEGMESVVELLAYNRAITELDLRDNAKVKAKGGHTLYEGVSVGVRLSCRAVLYVEGG